MALTASAAIGPARAAGDFRQDHGAWPLARCTKRPAPTARKNVMSHSSRPKEGLSIAEIVLRNIGHHEALTDDELQAV